MVPRVTTRTFELIRKTPGHAYIETGTQRRIIGQDFIVQGVQSNIPANTTDVVFAGYGIESDRYSDYAGLDVQGKAVLFFMGEPVGRNGNSLVTGTSSPSEWANDTRKKTALAFQKGAQSVFVVYADAKPDQWAQSLSSYRPSPSLKMKYKLAGQKNTPVFTSVLRLPRKSWGFPKRN
jgi:hypothetical protein